MACHPSAYISCKVASFWNLDDMTHQVRDDIRDGFVLWDLDDVICQVRENIREVQFGILMT